MSRHASALLAALLLSVPAFSAGASRSTPLDQDAAEPALPTGTDIQDRPYPPLHYARFPGEPPRAPLTYDRIVQGELGSCFFLSTLAAIAKTRPDLLEGRLRGNGEGGYEVALYDAAGRRTTVRVDDRFPATTSGTVFFGRGRDAGDIRPALFEKAFAKLRGGYSAIDGGDASDAFLALTGKKGRDHAPDSMSDAELWALIRKALAQGHPVVASTREFDELKRLTGDEDLAGVIDDHVYMVLGLDSKDGRRVVRLYTPLSPRDAGNKKTDERRLTVELSAFKKYFDAVTVGS